MLSQQKMAEESQEYGVYDLKERIYNANNLTRLRIMKPDLIFIKKRRK